MHCIFTPLIFNVFSNVSIPLLPLTVVSVQEAIQILKQDKSQNSAKRDLYKSINKIVGQIGGTQEQASP